jgi:hypothetical protein
MASGSKAYGTSLTRSSRSAGRPAVDQLLECFEVVNGRIAKQILIKGAILKQSLDEIMICHQPAHPKMGASLLSKREKAAKPSKLFHSDIPMMMANVVDE